jgi:oligoribonuclease
MHPQNLVWIDLEMTGLSPENDRIIEIASIVTDAHLNILAEGPVMAVKQTLKRLTEMDNWNTKTHTESGLVKRVRESTIDEKQAEKATIDFISRYVSGGHSPLCGNSVCQDRRFMAHYMPKLESYLHYRNLDVSSVKELVVRWRPEILEGFRKKNTHQAMDDIRESIEELKFYRKTFINVAEP